LNGKKYGTSVRKSFDLNKLDNIDGNISVLISKSILFITASFFTGLFMESIKILGETKFREKYRFYEECDYHTKYIDECINACKKEIYLERMEIK